MGLFKNLFGGRNADKNTLGNEQHLANHDANSEASLEAFKTAFNKELQRYYSAPGSKLEFTTQDENGNEQDIFSGLAEVRRQWEQIHSAWDKRALLFEVFDELFGKYMRLWQAVERYTIDRQAPKALALAEEHASDEDLNSVDFLCAKARALYALSRYDEGIVVAKKAVELDPASKKARMILADLYHLSDKHDESHALYEGLMGELDFSKIPESTISIANILDFEHQMMHSPVYAVVMLSSAGDETDEATWDKIAEEFYYCPYFRFQHAFYLAKKGQNLKCLAKMVALTQEFPWFKDGVVNAHSLILQFRDNMKDPAMMQQEEQYLAKLIERNGWK